MNKSTSRDGRADNAQALKACDPTGRVGSNPTPDATSTFYFLKFRGNKSSSKLIFNIYKVPKARISNPDNIFVCFFVLWIFELYGCIY